MQPLFLIFIAATAVLTATALASPGGWEPIKDLNEPYVKEIANFAVTEYNKQFSKSLKLDSIEKGENKVVSGVNYRLVIAAVDGTATATATKQYEAVVSDQPWVHVRILKSFKSV